MKTMWTRKEVKERAKEALSRNYWKAVAVSFLIFLLMGSRGGPTASVHHEQETEAVAVTEAVAMEDGSMEDAVTADGEDSVREDTEYTLSPQMEAHIDAEVAELADSLKAIAAEIEQMEPVTWVVFAIVFMIIFLIILAVVIAIYVLLVNPLSVGMHRFMLKGVDGTGKAAELGYTFDHNYKNGVKTTFVYSLHIAIGVLLFVVPGIYKMYQYYMVKYILAENPDMPCREVLERSKKMMDGHKWDTFLLDLSFIPWYILKVVTAGIAWIFYGLPYLELTRASLYRTLQEKVEN
ncbi:MAG: DUF975 family protein [Bacillus sp. (in: Bacteria)]|nr:DUF975 family protein [Bacillus sp. (in: firmicutes)]MCM1427193.1 DUF975 family protein [Eubacterium sp.]